MIVVNHTLPSSQAEKMGLKEGDVFVEYDGKFFSDSAKFINYRKTEERENSRELIVLRGEEWFSFNVFPGQMGADLGLQVTPLEEIEKIKTDVQKFQESKK